MACRTSFKIALIIVLLPVALTFSGCSNVTNPLTELKQSLANEKEFSIILSDMMEEGNFFKSYYHQYQVDIGENSSIKPFVEVSKDYYQRHIPYLGMVLLSKGEDGKIKNTPMPNGYQYVGNPKYGHWRNDSSGSFWEFYGQYMLLSQVMNWGGYGLRRNDYNTFVSYNTSGRPYYGPSNQYGTNGTVTQKQRPAFYNRKKSKMSSSKSRFAQKVDSKRGRSKNTFRSRGSRFGK